MDASTRALSSKSASIDNVRFFFTNHTYPV
jgi:hypothetical protein